MEKKDLEAMLPNLQQRYTEATDEVKRLEGDFRTIQQLINNWKDPSKGDKKGDKAVDAQTNPTTS